jgi:hypothetical protein
VSFVTWRRAVLGAGAGAVFGLVLTAFLMLTGALQMTPGSLPASRVLADAVVSACVQLAPWLLLWLMVLPALLRVPFGQPWLAMAIYTGLAVVLVPRALDVNELAAPQLIAIGLCALVTALPIVRAADVWLVSAFVAGLHFVTVTLAGLLFGGKGGYGLYDSRVTGDVLLTGGAMGPLFGLFGMLGLCWIAGLLLQHQRVIFAGALSRLRSRRGALADFGLGLLVSSAAVALMFIAMQFSQQSRIAAFSPALSPISDSLTQQLPRALATQWLYAYVLVSVLVLVLRRGWIAVLAASAIAAGVHLLSPGTNTFTALSLALMVMAGGFAFVSTGRLWMSVALSYGWLLSEGPIFGFSSGGFQVRHPWFQQEILQFTEWSGGVYGPDASLFGLIAKALIVVAVVWLRGLGQKDSK